MILPLYNHSDHEGNNLIKTPGEGNTGLWYNKFFLNWNENWELKSNAKLNWIKEVVWEKKNRQAVRRKIGDPNLLTEYSHRIHRLVHSLGGEIRIYATTWHLATGLGLSHPIENGMTWHHTLGVPYLPGSAVKGVVRTWAEEWADNYSPEDVERIFGPQHDKRKNNSDKKTVGTVLFFDALPVQPVELAADIMTPHYHPYYSSTNKLPGDWYNPNPIPFLTVNAGQLFMFAVAPRKKENTPDLDLVLQWLDEALTITGVGTKTAAGYGRFTCRSEGER